jgi:hypothetical protein
MDRRSHERWVADFEVQVTDLRDPDHAVSGRVRDISQSGICAMLPLSFTPGSSIRLKMADSVVFGHVVYSNAEGAVYRTGIEVAQVLLGGTDLSRILQRTLRETAPGTLGLEPPETFLG